MFLCVIVRLVALFRLCLKLKLLVYEKANNANLVLLCCGFAVGGHLCVFIVAMCWLGS